MNEVLSNQQSAISRQQLAASSASVVGSDSLARLAES